MHCRTVSRVGVIVALALTIALDGSAFAGAKSSHVQWVNHFDLTSGDPSVTQTSSLSTNSGVGGGLTGLVISSTTAGDVDSFGGNKVVQMALELQPQTRIAQVVVCYELTSSNSYIDQVRLAQVQNPPAVAVVQLDDATPLTNVGPVCVTTDATSVDSSNGSVLLSLRVNFAASASGGPPTDKIVVRALGLIVDKD
jgi:hypothetical protein